MSKLRYGNRPRYEVDRAMIGDEIPDGFDLRAFCDALQMACPDLRIVPILDSENGARNGVPDILDDAVWHDVLDAYCDALDARSAKID